MDAVEAFWTSHTVRDEEFPSAAASLAYLDWRSREYTLFHDLMGLWGNHDADVVLDFGCGPANDLVGFLVHGNARHAVGIDISATSLRLAEKRLALHGIDPARYDLIKASSDPVIPLPDGSVDFIYSQGVLHHTIDPKAILTEFHRVLRPGGVASIMVYNHDSLFFHLYVAYRRQLMEGFYPGLTIEDAFQRSTDGSECPISVAYHPDDFLGMCLDAGFSAEYLGGYFHLSELEQWEREGKAAMADERLGIEHREFLRSLDTSGGFPTRDSLPVGIGGVFRLQK